MNIFKRISEWWKSNAPTNPTKNMDTNALKDEYIQLYDLYIMSNINAMQAFRMDGIEAELNRRGWYAYAGATSVDFKQK